MIKKAVNIVWSKRDLRCIDNEALFHAHQSGLPLLLVYFFEPSVMNYADSDFINANMIELKLTGFMSNRGRQNIASYFCNELNMDWRYGAAYFESQLIDYDVCSNWGNWAYLAGVGNDARNHRYFNIEKQANDYDKKTEFRQLWLK